MDRYQTSLEKMASYIKQDDLKLKLKVIEKQIFEDKNALNLINNFQIAQDNFNFYYAHFKNDKDIIKKYKNILIEAKRNMDNYSLIKKYNALYNKIIEPSIYLEIKLKDILSKDGIKKC